MGTAGMLALIRPGRGSVAAGPAVGPGRAEAQWRSGPPSEWRSGPQWVRAAVGGGRGRGRSWPAGPKGGGAGAAPRVKASGPPGHSDGPAVAGNPLTDH
jgi:hypothetical protein